MKNILIIKSTGLINENINQIKKLYSSSSNIIVSVDEFDSIYKIVSKNKINALIGCPRFIFTERLFSKLEDLEWVHNSGAGVEDYFFDSFAESDIKFTNGKIIQGPEVADHAVALLLSFTRNLNYLINNKDFKQKNYNRPIELKDKNCLIFGLGGIGMCIAERLKGFGMKIFAVSEELPYLSSFVDKYYTQDDFPKISKDCDVVICSAPSTKKTKNFFNKSIFNKMKKNSYFINVSRGNLVNTDDLINFLEKDFFLGVGLDVTDPEPLSKNHKLRKFKNVIISPHLAGLSDYNRIRSFELIKLNIRRYLNNDHLLNIVDKQKEY